MQQKEIIRALWLNQPYASLMIHGKIETRSYSTEVRGKVLICATKKAYIDNDVLSISGLRQMVRLTQLFYKKGLCSLEPYNYNFLPCGQAIAIGDLVDCRPMTLNDEDKCFVQYQTEIFKSCGCEESDSKSEKGDCKTIVKPALYCWIFENVKTIEPFFIQESRDGAILNEETINKIKLSGKVF